MNINCQPQQALVEHLSPETIPLTVLSNSSEPSHLDCKTASVNMNNANLDAVASKNVRAINDKGHSARTEIPFQ